MDFFKSSEVENKDKGSGKNVFSDAFVDKMNDDFKEAQEVCEASNEIVDSLHDLPEKDLADETVFVDKLPEVVGIDFILGLFSNEFLNSVHNSYGFNLSENEIAESVQKASDFFHLSSPKDIREDWTTGVILGMKQKGNDDVLCFNREQMKEMGITVVLITHYMDEAVKADRVIVMDSGSVVLDGTPREVFSQEKIIEEAGLELPDCSKLALAMRKNGIDFPLGILTPEEFIEAFKMCVSGGRQ